MCAFAGLRLGEAAGLQLGGLDFLRRTMSIQRQIQGQVNSKMGELSPKYESARLRVQPEQRREPMAEPAGEGGHGGFTLHDLRHYFASGLIADGCDVATVQHALGHSSASITLNVYSHPWPKAEDRTWAAAANLMATTAALADSVRIRAGA